MRNRLYALPVALSLGLLLAVPAGCATHSGRPVPPGQKPIFVSQARIPGLNAPLPDDWHRVFVGELPRPKLEGYMRTRVVQENDHALTLHWVYDSQFNLAGVMTDLGKTTRFDRHGKPEYLGTLSTEEGLLAILGHDQVAAVHISDMPAPRE